MEKAVLKTFIYADIFDYPLKAWEVHKWLIGKKASLHQVDKILYKLEQKGKIKNRKGYYFLTTRAALVKKRLERESISRKYLHELNLISWLLKVIPWIELVGVSGSLAMENTDKYGDLDLFIVTQNNRLWITRLMILLLISLTGKRRTREDTRKTAAGKVCVNVLLERSALVQHKDLYTAHEILQMKVLWQRHNCYSEFLDVNSWAMEMIPNWVSTYKEHVSLKKDSGHAGMTGKSKIETWVKRLQLRYMKNPHGDEKMTDNAVYFHPHDYRQKVLNAFKQRVKLINTP